MRWGCGAGWPEDDRPASRSGLRSGVCDEADTAPKPFLDKGLQKAEGSDSHRGQDELMTKSLDEIARPKLTTALQMPSNFLINEVPARAGVAPASVADNAPPLGPLKAFS